MTWLAIKLFLSGALGRIGSALGASFSWALRTQIPLLAGLLTMLVAVVGWHEYGVKTRQVAGLTAVNATLRHDLDVDATTIQNLQAAITKQNAAIADMKKASDQAQAAGAKAVQQALARSASRAVLSNAITVPAKAPATCDARTPGDVLNAKGSL